jgi:hypothetical protein
MLSTSPYPTGGRLTPTDANNYQIKSNQTAHLPPIHHPFTTRSPPIAFDLTIVPYIFHHPFTTQFPPIPRPFPIDLAICFFIPLFCPNWLLAVISMHVSCVCVPSMCVHTECGKARRKVYLMSLPSLLPFNLLYFCKILVAHIIKDASGALCLLVLFRFMQGSYTRRCGCLYIHLSSSYSPISDLSSISLL